MKAQAAPTDKNRVNASANNKYRQIPTVSKSSPRAQKGIIVFGKEWVGHKKAPNHHKIIPLDPLHPCIVELLLQYSKGQ